jgi:N-acyl-D-amino-acid deacylase
MMRIASVSKPITAAAIRDLVAKDRLALETPAFNLLALKTTKGGKVDPEMSKITIEHLLDHKGGWDRAASFDPMFAVPRIKKELALARALNPADVVRFMQTQPLDFEPGKKVAYSNFGYCVLGRVLEKVHGKPYFAAVQELVFKPHGIADVRLGVDQVSRRDPREVEYPAAAASFSIDVMDAHGGLVASAPALCGFMNNYVLNGEKRRPGGTIDSTFFGSMPGTTAMARQRKDGLNVAVLINNRRDANYNDDLRTLKAAVDKALDTSKR